MTGYGTDIWCTDSVHTGRLARGVTVVAQALYRRQITPRGVLRGGDEEANYGIDLSGYVGSVGPELAAAALPSVIRGELLKDDRVSDVDVEVTLSRNGIEWSMLITERITLHDSDGEFTLTLSVNAVNTELLGVSV